MWRDTPCHITVTTRESGPGLANKETARLGIAEAGGSIGHAMLFWSDYSAAAS